MKIKTFYSSTFCELDSDFHDFMREWMRKINSQNQTVRDYYRFFCLKTIQVFLKELTIVLQHKKPREQTSSSNCFFIQVYLLF